MKKAIICIFLVILLIGTTIVSVDGYQLALNKYPSNLVKSISKSNQDGNSIPTIQCVWSGKGNNLDVNCIHPLTFEVNGEEVIGNLYFEVRMFGGTNIPNVDGGSISVSLNGGKTWTEVYNLLSIFSNWTSLKFETDLEPSVGDIIQVKVNYNTGPNSISPGWYVCCINWGYVVEGDTVIQGIFIFGHPSIDWGDWIPVEAQSYNTPPNNPFIEGPSNSLKPNKSYEYFFNTIDAEGNEVFYYLDWGDGTMSEWLGPYESNESIKIEHIWPEPESSYLITVKAKDIFGLEGQESTLEVTTPKNKPYINTPFLQFLENHPYMFPLLRHLLGL